jgi:hypothetical protein
LPDGGDAGALTVTEVLWVLFCVSVSFRAVAVAVTV